MSEIPINWRLQRGNNLEKGRYISNLAINSEWSLLCWWWCDSYGYYHPEHVEIQRRSTAGDIMISGNLKLIRTQTTCVGQRKFVQLIEDGFATTLIEFKHSYDPYYDTLPEYSITGTLTIPASGVPIKEDKKGVNFGSLLELSSDFQRLLDPESTYLTDVNLKCGTDSFSVHKSILSVRSPVFAAMFATEMKEHLENKVNISDISPHVLKTLLNYIYTGKTGELSVQSAGELLFAADKYQIVDLKRVCSDFLKKSVSVQNVLNILVLGYLHHSDLSDFAMDFICNSGQEFDVLEKTAQWKNLREERPSLAIDVLTRVVKSKDEKLRSYR